MAILQGRTRWIRLLTLLVCVVVLVLLARGAATFLIIDAPRRSDAILVLAGETEKRPERGIQLLSEGYGRVVIIDVPEGAKIYEFDQVQLAKEYIAGLPQAAAVSVCPTVGLSTKDETKDAERCLVHTAAKSVLIVTADFHTRRALSVFRHELPQYEYSVAAVRNSQNFGPQWWTHRQWAKTLVDEWMRLIWWSAVDRWR